MKLPVIILTALLCGSLQASTVKLSQAVDLPLVVEGKTVGSMKLPAGSEVELVSINGTNAVIKRGDSTYTIAFSSLGTSTAVAAASPATPTATPTQTPVQASAPIDKTLTDSTLSHFYITPGEHTPSDIDASRLKDDLPGAHGWITVKNGHLYNGDKRLRIVGVNMGVYMPKLNYEWDPNHILEMKKYGINGLRVSPRNNRKEFKNQKEKAWNSFDKLVAFAIQNGMWIETGILEDAADAEIDPESAKKDKEILKEFFAHVNPYTGRAYANEPAIFNIELVNENGMYGENYLHSNLDMKYFKNFEIYKDKIQALWNGWVKTRYSSQTALDQAWPNNKETLGSVQSLSRENWSQFPHEKEEDWRRFLISLEVNWYKEAISYLHNDLHYKGLVSTSAEISVPPVTANLGEIVRNQGYHSGQNIKESETKTASIGKWQQLDTSAVWRVAGKPFIQSEHNFVGAPNLYQGEVALYALTAATVQDWDGVFLFPWDQPWEKDQNTERIGAEDTIHNSGLLASLPTAINLFRRGDLKPPTTHKFGEFNSQALLTNGESKWVYGSAELGDLFNTRLGTAFTNELVGFDPNANLFGEWGTSFSDRNYNVEVNTPKTVLAISERVKDKINLGGTTLEVGKTLLNWICFGVTSLNNDLPIKDSNKLLVTLIGQIGERGKEIPPTPGIKQDWKHWQQGPCMMECISANVFIPVDTSKGHFKAYSLDDKAQKKAEIPLEITPEGITLHTTGKEGTVWYEIVRL